MSWTTNPLDEDTWTGNQTTMNQLRAEDRVATTMLLPCGEETRRKPQPVTETPTATGRNEDVPETTIWSLPLADAVTKKMKPHEHAAIATTMTIEATSPTLRRDDHGMTAATNPTAETEGTHHAATMIAAAAVIVIAETATVIGTGMTLTETAGEIEIMTRIAGMDIAARRRVGLALIQIRLGSTQRRRRSSTRIISP